MTLLQSRTRKSPANQASVSRSGSANQNWEEDTVVLPTEYEQQLQAISRRLEKCRS